MGDGSDELAVLNDGTAAHALYDAAGEFQKLFVHDADHHPLIFLKTRVIHFLNFDLIISHLPRYVAADKGLTLVDVLAEAHGNGLGLEPFQEPAVDGPEDPLLCIGGHFPQLCTFSVIDDPGHDSGLS